MLVFLAPPTDGLVAYFQSSADLAVIEIFAEQLHGLEPTLFERHKIAFHTARIAHAGLDADCRKWFRYIIRDSVETGRNVGIHLRTEETTGVATTVATKEADSVTCKRVSCPCQDRHVESLPTEVNAPTETTQIYLHADMQLKERALAHASPSGIKPSRFRPKDALLAFLESLCVDSRPTQNLRSPIENPYGGRAPGIIRGAT